MVLCIILRRKLKEAATGYKSHVHCGGTLEKLNGERHHQVVIFVAIVGDAHRQMPQISLPGGDIHHLVFTVHL